MRTLWSEEAATSTDASSTSTMRGRAQTAAPAPVILGAGATDASSTM